MKNRITCILSLAILCSNITLAQTTAIRGNYLGQTQPGTRAEIFMPGIISTSLNDRDLVFSPGMNEIIYCVLEKPHSVMIGMKCEEGIWSAPYILPFSGKYNDCEPQFSPDGRRLYFSSDRPLKEGDKPKDYDIWYVERSDRGWGEPQNPGAPLNSDKNEFYPSVTTTGVLYFTSHNMKICKSRITENGFEQPEMLTDSVNSGSAEYNAYIAPDESYLIFTSHGWEGGRAGRGDLFISFRKNDGTWSKAYNFGSEVNSPTADMSPSVTPDGKFLFFSSWRTNEEYDPEPINTYEEIFMKADKPMNGRSDVYWVSTVIIDSLKKVCLGEIKQ